MRYYKTITTLVFALVFSGLAYADESSDPATAYRQQSMKAASQHLKAIKSLLKNDFAFRQQISLHTRAMREFADAIPGMFPKDADYFESEASDTIWEKWDDFGKRAGNTASAAREVEQAFLANNMDKANEAYDRLRRSCKSCHDDYRE